MLFDHASQLMAIAERKGGWVYYLALEMGECIQVNPAIAQILGLYTATEMSWIA